MKKNGKSDRKIFLPENKLIPALITSAILAAVVFSISFFTFRKIKAYLRSKPSVSMLREKWSTYDYESVYDTSSALIEKDPFNNTVLTYRGYSAFYLAVSATEPSQAQIYINEAIKCLRLSLIDAKKKTVPQIEYMLGKTYFYKDVISSYHFYSDLAVKYLKAAKEHGYEAEDIPEYLGLSYADLNMNMESIASFSEALLNRESDTLLFAIAEQYYKAKQLSASKQYLYQIISRSDDDSLVIKSRVLLGNIFLEEESYEDAEKEFQAILEKNENSADAHYGLGVIYEAQGNLVKARSEWRKTLRLQVNHAEALKKLSQNR